MVVIKLTYYREKDWSRFIKIIDDRESMHNTWKEWHKGFLKSRKGLVSFGFEVVDIETDLDKLINYCEFRGIKNDGKARSHFVQTK